MGGVETARRPIAAAPGLVVVLVSIECGAAALVRKQELRPALPRELWAAHAS